MRGRIRINIWVLAGAALGAVVPMILLMWPSLGGVRLAFPALWKYWIISGALLVDGLGLWLLTWPRLAGRVEVKLMAGATMVLASLFGLGTYSVIGRLLPPQLAVQALSEPAKAMPAASAKTPDAPPAKPAPAPSKPAGNAPAPAKPAPEPAKPPAQQQAELEDSIAMDLLKRNCMGRCHNYDNRIGGTLVMSDLKKLGEQRTMSYMIQLIRDPINVGVKTMPKVDLTDQEIFMIARFLSGRGGDKGQEKPWFGNYTLDMTPQEAIEAGKKKYAFFNCQNCHKIEGQGGDMGPDLSKVGAQRDAAWIESFLTSPQTVKPGTAQPFLPMAVDEIKQLAAYLASLR